MTKYQQKITEARRLLGLPEAAAMATIKSSYRALLSKWHPDKCRSEDREKCVEMTRRIIAANKILMDYCQRYQYSFSEEAIRNHLPPEDWWFDRFGEDPLWGSGKKDGRR